MAGKLNLPKSVNIILDLFSKKGYEIYIVGGAVRDLLMGKMVSDWDFTTNANPEQIIEILPKNAFYGNVFGTVMLPVTDVESPFDITTFRTESGYSDARRPDKVTWGKSLKEDLQRRDFTINAMALKNANSEIIDSFGGQKDLKKKQIKAVGDPRARFSEDALRMLRAIRIAGELKFKIDPKTLLAIKEFSPLINRIAKERVKEELFKILSSSNPYQGFVLLKDSNLMDEILPEFAKTFGVEQKSPGRHHIYDVGTHSLYSLKQVAIKNQNPIVRFATLIHDIGKPLTYKKLDNGTITFYNHEVVGARIAKRIAERLHFSTKEKDKLWKLVRHHQFSVTEKQTDKAIRRFIKNVGIENIKDMLDLRTGDRLGGGASETSWRTEEFKKRLIEVQKQPFSLRDLKINGEDIMNELKIKPGPQIGKLLGKLFSEVQDNKLPNNKKALLKKLKEISI